MHDHAQILDLLQLLAHIHQPNGAFEINFPEDDDDEEDANDDEEANDDEDDLGDENMDDGGDGDGDTDHEMEVPGDDNADAH